MLSSRVERASSSRLLTARPWGRCVVHTLTPCPRVPRRGGAYDAIRARDLGVSHRAGDVASGHGRWVRQQHRRSPRGRRRVRVSGRRGSRGHRDAPRGRPRRRTRPSRPPPAVDSGVDSSPAPDATEPPVDATADTATPDAADAALPTASVRVGFFVSQNPFGNGAGPDVCFAPHGTGLWQGPVLAAAGLVAWPLAVDADRLLPGPRRADRRADPPARADCLHSGRCGRGRRRRGRGGRRPAHGADRLHELAGGRGWRGVDTVALVDSSSGPAGVEAFVDETTTSAGKAKLRFINVATQINGGPVTFGLGAGAPFDPLFPNVSPAPGIDTTADPNGYREIDPVSTIETESPRRSRSPIGLSTPPVALPAGAIFTTFAAEALGTAAPSSTISSPASTALPAPGARRSRTAQ